MEYNIYQKKSNSPFIVILLPLLLFCPFCVFGQIAKVNKVWLEHGTLKNGGKGITIHADINVNGMKGKEIKAIAYFYDGEKNKLMGGVSGYKTKNGQVCAADYGTPSYDKSHYKDFNIFIPYESLPLLSGKRTYYISLRIQDNNSHNFISEKSNYVSFIGTGNSDNRNRDVKQHNSSRGYSMEYAYLLDKYSKYDHIPISCGMLVKTSKDIDNSNYKMYKFRYDSGWVKQLTLSPCQSCLGDGRCHSICSYRSLSVGYTTPCECELLGKRGECIHCNGTGLAIAFTATNDDTDYGYDAQGHIQLLSGGGTSSGSYNSSSSTSGGDKNSRSSNNSLYKTCHVCNGTGKCQSCNGSGVRFASTSYVSCGGCSNANGNGKCYMCRGTGRL